uniref:Uncharacterized protein n=1 Tax=Arundo donax TaxID=35708 RepID=A0A0A9EXC2_ARUDO
MTHMHKDMPPKNQRCEIVFLCLFRPQRIWSKCTTS